MINILLPMAGVSDMFDPKIYRYPQPLVEVLGKPMIELVVSNLHELGDDGRFIFVVRAEDCRRFHLDHTLELLTSGRCEIVRLQGETQGALCSALMAIEQINDTSPLVIANTDQLFDPSMSAAFDRLRASGADAGCLSFESVHPRWSYVRVVDGKVVEAAEKNPISRHAIAGFYYFASGTSFVRAAMRAVLNQRTVEGRYFIAPVFNELILDGKVVVAESLAADSYHSFFTPQRIEEYERLRQARQ